MATRRASPPPREPLALKVPLEQAAAKIDTQIQQGHELTAAKPRNQQELDELSKRYKLWSDYNRELLRTLFTTDELAEEYSFFFGVPIRAGASLTELLEYEKAHIDNSLTRLQSIRNRLELLPAPTSAPSPASTHPPQKAADLKKVFVVHGHDVAAKESVARLVERLGLEAIILHEQASLGGTVIEKIETHADVRFAVVLLTADDVGASRDDAGNLKPRARQNVVLELGYFLARLGRKNVCPLKAEDVEVPSDLAGVVYVTLDPDGAWRFKLAREMKAAGLSVDLNLVV